MVDNACPALAVHQLSAGYPGLPDALLNASFEVEHGERLGILGPNGAGKSTLFKAIVGLIPHHTGYISIHGEDCDTSHTMVGYVPQAEEIDWHFPVTVRDVVMMGRIRKIGWFRFPTRQHWYSVDAVLDRVGMLPFRHRQISELSGGQRRRVFIARALAQETDVLLLDEPFSGVDAAAEQEISSILDRLREEGVTVLLATHDLGAAQKFFDKLLLLKQSVIACGRPEEVFTAQALQQTYGRRVGIFHSGEDTIAVVDGHGDIE
jgi:ABC-type Mn2+/Zn2+ transport system ATPase subunit